MRSTVKPRAFDASVPVDAAGTPCVRYTATDLVSFDGTSAVLCPGGLDSTRSGCEAIRRDGQITAVSRPAIASPVGATTTVSKDGRSLELCNLPNACVTVAPKLARDQTIFRANPNRTGTLIEISRGNNPSGEHFTAEILDGSGRSLGSQAEVDREDVVLSISWLGSSLVVGNSPLDGRPGTAVLYSPYGFRRVVDLGDKVFDMAEIDDSRSVVVRDARVAILDANNGGEVGSVALDRLFEGMGIDDPDYDGDVGMLHTPSAVAIVASATSRRSGVPIYLRVAFVDLDSRSANVVELPRCD